MTDLVFQPAHRLAAMIRERQVSSAEAVEAFLGQIARHNPAINAICTLDADGARARAKSADGALARGENWGPLHGVPMTIKDAIATAGLRTTGGYEPLKDYVPSADAPVVARVKAAGAVILGKTNLPVLSADMQANNPIFGRTNNPWNLARIPGGSTGGGAAALASGMTSLELGSDVGGSVRLPAHCCGVFSIRPTDHLVPTTGHIPELPTQPRIRRIMTVIGPLARSVEDLRLALQIIAGPDGIEWEVPPVTLTPTAAKPFNQLRFAWSDGFPGIPVTRETRAAVAKLAADLAARGATVEQGLPPDFDFDQAWETRGELGGATAWTLLDMTDPAARAKRQAEVDRELSRGTPSGRGSARMVDPYVREMVVSLAKRDQFIGALERFLAGYDAFLCPVMACPAFPHCEMGTPIDIDGQNVAYGMAGAGHTNIFNLTGSPVVVAPLTRSADGLPIGVQIVGRRWTDMALLATAERVAEVTGGFVRPPGY